MLVHVGAARRGVSTQATLDRVEGTGLHFAQPLRVLVEVFVLAELDEFVHALRRRLEALGIHAGELREFFERVGLVAEAVLHAAGKELIEIRELRPRSDHAEVAARQPFLDHFFAGRVVEYCEAFAAHFFEGVRDVFERKRFVRDAVALQRGLEIGLEERGEKPHVFGLRDAVLPELQVGRNALQPKARLHADVHVDELRAGALEHLNAVARAAGRARAFIARVRQILLDHFLVVGETARRDDGRIRTDRERVAVLRFRLHALHHAAFHDEFGGGRARHDLAALILDALCKFLHENGPVTALVHVPGAVAVDEGGLDGFVVHAVVGEPIVDARGLFEPAVQCLRVDAPVMEVHHALELALGRHADVVGLLQGGAHEEGPFHVVAAATDHSVLFENDRLEARVRCGDARRRP